MSKLNDQQLLDLVGILDTDGLKALLQEINHICDSMEKDVITFSLDNKDSKEKLYLIKARLDGARHLVAALRSRLNQYKSK